MWIDKLQTLARLVPGLDAHADCQLREGIEIRRWREDVAQQTDVADVVVETFACKPPEHYLAAMAQRDPKPVWINLEYLSAESWTDGCHALASPHPRLPLTKYFFFPGFSAATGGLLHEATYESERVSFAGDRGAATAFLERFGVPRASDDALRMSLFCYRSAPAEPLIAAWARGDRQIQCLVPADQVAAIEPVTYRRNSRAPGTWFRRGALELHVIPFLTQSDYDRLLMACDCNFVRGEDSFVRAQWARRPLVWQIYPTPDQAHRIKLKAFLDRYCAGLGEDTAAVVREMWEAWNGSGDIASRWRRFVDALPQLESHAQPWANALLQHGDLAANLVRFSHARL